MFVEFFEDSATRVMERPGMLSSPKNSTASVSTPGVSRPPTRVQSMKSLQTWKAKGGSCGSRAKVNPFCAMACDRLV